LDRNERNQPFSIKFFEGIIGKISGELFMVYPELDQVYEKVARWLDIDADRLMLHSGSEQAIKAVYETYINPGQVVLLHFPGYAMYPVYCKMFQAEAVGQYFNAQLHFDWDAFINKINNNIRMVVVENPNGFVGISPKMDKLEALIRKAHETGVIVLVDEAYYHFHDETVAGLIDQFDNLIIVRTFSKAFGLAGLRGGYLLSNPENIYYLKKVRPVYEINSITGLVISELIDHLEELTTYVAETKENLAALRYELQELGIETSDSRANFVAARLGEPRIHDELRASLQKQGILIRRPFREESLKEWIRISTGPLAVQEILLKELRKILMQ
jgi:histidinol-phosphate aminotransferase